MAKTIAEKLEGTCNPEAFKADDIFVRWGSWGLGKVPGDSHKSPLCAIPLYNACSPNEITFKQDEFSLVGVGPASKEFWIRVFCRHPDQQDLVKKIVTEYCEKLKEDSLPTVLCSQFPTSVIAPVYNLFFATERRRESKTSIRKLCTSCFLMSTVQFPFFHIRHIWGYCGTENLEARGGERKISHVAAWRPWRPLRDEAYA